LSAFHATIRVMAPQGWLERLTGFREADYASTQRRLVVEGDDLGSTSNDKRYGIGNLSLPTLAELRPRVNLSVGQQNAVRCLAGDARALHAQPKFAGVLFQVASQFNLLEMVSPHVTPEDGVARYAYDPTQGPACAMAAGAATIYRNYCVPVDGGTDQTRDRQLDALVHVGAALSQELERPVNAQIAGRASVALFSHGWRVSNHPLRRRAHHTVRTCRHRRRRRAAGCGP
jgi:hypothetical protein